MNLNYARYDIFPRVLHWVVAVDIIYATIIGYSLHFISDISTYQFFSELNMSLATVVAVLMLLRFIWRFFRPSVPYTGLLSVQQKNLAVFMHELFYLIILLVLLSGFLMLQHSYQFFGLFTIPQPLNNLPVNQFFFRVHRISCIGLDVMIFLHLAAVIKLQWFNKKNILRRML